MNEVKLQNALWLDRGRQAALVCPNYSPSGWTECDLWLVTKSGYATEFEVKVSLVDFKNDQKKVIEWREKIGPNWWDKVDRKATKHDLLAQGDARGPSRFFFVVTKELGLTAESVPPWAGLIVASMVDSWKPGVKRICLSEVKPAPKLHQTKVDQKIVTHCRSVFFYRYWNLRTRERSERFLIEQENASPPEPPCPATDGELTPEPCRTDSARPSEPHPGSFPSLA